MPRDLSLYAMIFWHSHGCFTHFEALGDDAALEVVEAASNFSLRQPLFHLDAKGQYPKATLPYLGECSGPRCAAIIAAYSIWSLRGKPDGESHAPPDSDLLQAAADAYRLWRQSNKADDVDRMSSYSNSANCNIPT